MTDALFRWLEATPLSVWTRESTSVFAFPAILAAHAIGMGLAAGISGAIASRVLGIAAGVPLASLRSFVPVLWFGFALNFISGVLLLVAYPTKALTNPVFYVKLLCIIAAMCLFVVTDRHLALERTREITATVGTFQLGVRADVGRSRPLRRLATLILLAWTGAIFAGRLLAYTHHRVLVDF